jgi:hypothetical protein
LKIVDQTFQLGKPVESIFNLRLHASAVPIQQLLPTASNFEPGAAQNDLKF